MNKIDDSSKRVNKLMLIVNLGFLQKLDLPPVPNVIWPISMLFLIRVGGMGPTGARFCHLLFCHKTTSVWNKLDNKTRARINNETTLSVFLGLCRLDGNHPC